ncbi:hypothetical protein BU16DRAFT_522267 [Lophium mytilinum]|uniref:S-adenosyl-L-methionine-dependent methyltransferase n=1 Tax=Lophium mytilinum TaxID=390894 RepID=A0A6A6R9F8_9PEZI|nr:hypothetical protein BU16DRAFT_522267 [Lophium mytilinum]
MDEHDDIYPLARDDRESQRLNAQHQLIVKSCDNYLLDPSIPRHGIRSVADIATGTGIWLADFADELTTSALADTQFEFIGFDISALQFPTEVKPGFNFVVHNMTTPFPTQYHNRYDVVNVRLVFGAIPKEQYATVAKNLLAVLKPGGYITWTEFQLDSPHDIWPGPILSHLKSTLCDYLSSVNLSLAPMVEIRAAFEANKLQDIVARDFVSFRHPELATEAQVWLKAALGALNPTSLARLGRVGSMEAAVGKWLGYEREIEEAYEKGVVPACPVVSLVGKKEDSRGLVKRGVEEIWKVLTDGGWCVVQ